MIKSIEYINEKIIILERNIYDHSASLIAVYSINDNPSTLERKIHFYQLRNDRES